MSKQDDYLHREKLKDFKIVKTLAHVNDRQKILDYSEKLRKQRRAKS